MFNELKKMNEIDYCYGFYTPKVLQFFSHSSA